MDNKLQADGINVARPFLPELAELQPYLEKIWSSSTLTNNGEIHQEFEQAVADYLGVKHISLFANGTLALIVALKVLGMKGEVITTPFTWVASAQAIHWNNLRPVFVDIEAEHLNIDPKKISEAITPKTCAILPVHIFGNPCDVATIQQISDTHKLKVLYDAAHSFGVILNGKTLCDFGDLSVLSFHATKVFSTCEGGAVVCHDLKTKLQLDALKNNGFTTVGQLAGYGLNAKMNELQAAFGLVQLKSVDRVIENRKQSFLKYCALLVAVRGIRIINPNENTKANYAYLPIIIDPGEFGGQRDDLLKFLKNHKIFARPYFHPLITDFPAFSMFRKSNLDTATSISNNILCLPLFYNISVGEIERVVEVIRDFQKIQSHHRF